MALDPPPDQSDCSSDTKTPNTGIGDDGSAVPIADGAAESVCGEGGGRKEDPTPAKRISLEAEVSRFTERLLSRFQKRIQRRPLSFKNRVQALIRLGLPPYPKPSGRPQEDRITKAAALYLQQQQEIKNGTRKRANWNPIAKQCIRGFHRIRSPHKRHCEIKRLRDAVYARIRTAKRADHIQYSTVPGYTGTRPNHGGQQ